jgi:hypothetical protein
MIEAIIQHASLPDENGQPSGNPYISMTYAQIPNDFHQRYAFQVIGGNANALPTATGIYFLLSHTKKRLQKIGMTNGQNGLRQRIKGYTRAFDPQNPGNDSSPAFWYRIMNGIDLRTNLGGERAIGNDYMQIDVYFRSLTQNQETNDQLAQAVDIDNLIYDPHADMERKLIAYAKKQRTPNNDDLYQAGEAYPLLLDSNHRIRAGRFA